MTLLQVKVFLWKQRLTLADIAAGVAKRGQSKEAVRVKLSQMVHGHAFYPNLAKRVERKYGLKLARNGEQKRKAA